MHFHNEESCQRLFNAIGAESYIPPHRHSLDPKHECLLAVNGLLALIIFDDLGGIINVTKFGSEIYTQSDDQCVSGVEIPANIWHTVVSITPSATLFEVKAGPFIPEIAKEVAPWAPDELSGEALSYLNFLKGSV